MIICKHCGRDIDEIGQDNVSSEPNYPICEECNRLLEEADMEDQCWLDLRMQELYLEQQNKL